MGNSSITGDEVVTFTDNMSFDGTQRGGKMTTDGQLWIGSSTSNRPSNGGHVRLGSLTSPSGTVQIGYSSPNITLDVSGGGTGIVEHLTGNTGGQLNPTAGNFNTVGTGNITISGSGSTLTTQLTSLTNHAIQIGAGTATLTQLGAGTTGQILQTNTAADPTWSTATYPSTAGTSGNVITSNGTNFVSQALPTPPETTLTNHSVALGTGTVNLGSVGPSATAGTILQSAGASADPAFSTATYPSTATGTGKILRADGTNWVATTATYPDTAGTSGNVLTSDGTNWSSSPPVVTTDLHAARFIVSAGGSANGANYTTIAAAITAAQSAGGNQTVFIQPGTYTENLTLVAGINLTAFGSDSSLNRTGNVIISGTCTLTGAGSVTISGIQLQTNSAALLAVTGSAASIVNLNNCYLNCTNNTGITFSSSSASARININNCQGNLGTTGIAYFSHSSAGFLFFSYCQLTNSGNSVTASTCSAGDIYIWHSNIANPLTFSSSSTNGSSIIFSDMDNNANNTTMLTTSGTGSMVVFKSYFASGTASAISIGTGTTVNLTQLTIASNNTNAITGAGTAVICGISFTGTSHQTNVTTQSGGAMNGLTQGTAPSAGMLGEQIRAQNASVSLSNSTPKTVVSMSIPSGVWDVSANLFLTYSTNVGVSCLVGISTNDNSFTGCVLGDSEMGVFNGAAGNYGNVSATIASFRVTLSAATTYYLVGRGDFVSGTCTASARLSATRVG